MVGGEDFWKISWSSFWTLLSEEKLMGMVNERLPTGNSLLNWNRFLHNIVPEKYTQTPLIKLAWSQVLEVEEASELGSSLLFCSLFLWDWRQTLLSGYPLWWPRCWERSDAVWGWGKIQLSLSNPICVSVGKQSFYMELPILCIWACGWKKKKRLVESILKDPEKILNILNIVFNPLWELCC